LRVFPHQKQNLGPATLAPTSQTAFFSCRLHGEDGEGQSNKNQWEEKQNGKKKRFFLGGWGKDSDLKRGLFHFFVN